MSTVIARKAPPISIEEWRALVEPENYRLEVIRGELVLSPSPSRPHQIVCANLFRLLDPLIPPDWRLLWHQEWTFTERGVVAMGPQPDLIVVPADSESFEDLPLLTVEVRSPSDHRKLEYSDLTRIEGKRVDYATYGGLDHLEIDLATGRPVVIRYEPRHGVMVEVDRAEGDKTLVSDRPFRYEVTPSALLPG
jgi:Uma2 family endonuclease